MMAFDALPPQQETTEVLIHDARAVSDTASLKFEVLMVQGRPTWVVAVVIPGPTSGSATVPGAHINAKTGEYVSPANAQTVLIKEGRWRAPATSEQLGEYADGAYSWSEPLVEKRKLATEDYYSPFARGGTILFRPKPGEAGIEQFGTVYLLFDGWDRYVAQAFTFISNHPALLGDSQVTPSEVPQLNQLLSENNKLLAVQAFRSLAVSGRMDPNLAGNRLTNAEVNLAAIYTFLMLISRVAGQPPFSQKLIDISRTTNDTTKLRSIALGAFSVGLFHSEDDQALSASKALLTAIRRRLKALGVAVDRDAYLVSIFQKMGV